MSIIEIGPVYREDDDGQWGWHTEEVEGSTPTGEQPPIPFVQPDDPGAVGAGAVWVQTEAPGSNPSLWVRNADDDGWNVGLFTPGRELGDGASESIAIRTGAAFDGSTGSINIEPGQSLDDEGGGIGIRGGVSLNDDGGNIEISGGNGSPLSGDGGDVAVQPGSGDTPGRVILRDSNGNVVAQISNARAEILSRLDVAPPDDSTNVNLYKVSTHVSAFINALNPDAPDGPSVYAVTATGEVHSKPIGGTAFVVDAGNGADTALDAGGLPIINVPDPGGEVLTGDPVTVASFDAERLTFDNFFSGLTLLDLADPTHPEFLDAGIYAISVTVRCAAAMTADANFTLTLHNASNGDALVTSAPATVNEAQPKACVQITHYFEQGASFDVDCENRDVVPRDFQIINCNVQRITK